MINAMPTGLIVDTLFSLQMHSQHEVKVIEASQAILTAVEGFTAIETLDACDAVCAMIKQALKHKKKDDKKKKNLKG
jgi:hypothetical protein